MADLELNHISKSFNGNYALQDVTFSCNRGEVHALLGENGAGKSTLLKVLAGAYRPDSGEIKVFGQTAQIRTPSDAMRYGIGCVYQELSFIPELTVAENIFIGRMLYSGKLSQLYLGMGDTYQMASVSAVAIGGISLVGGSGSYIGAIAGSFVIIILDGLLAAMSLSQGVQKIIYGIVLFFAVLISSRKKSTR